MADSLEDRVTAVEKDVAELKKSNSVVQWIGAWLTKNPGTAHILNVLLTTAVLALTAYFSGLLNKTPPEVSPPALKKDAPKIDNQAPPVETKPGPVVPKLGDK